MSHCKVALSHSEVEIRQRSAKKRNLCLVACFRKVLLSVRSWDPTTLGDLYALVRSWPKPDIAGIFMYFDSGEIINFCTLITG